MRAGWCSGSDERRTQKWLIEKRTNERSARQHVLAGTNDICGGTQGSLRSSSGQVHTMLSRFTGCDNTTGRATREREFWMDNSTKWSDNESSILWRSFRRLFIQSFGQHILRWRRSYSAAMQWRCVDVMTMELVKGHWNMLRINVFECNKLCWFETGSRNNLLDWCRFASYGINWRLINFMCFIDGMF